MELLSSKHHHLSSECASLAFATHSGIACACMHVRLCVLACLLTELACLHSNCIVCACQILLSLQPTC